ncbi:MAG: hypothetical protein ACYC7A_08910 [Thermoanaerobaculia bacterium]
MNDRKPSLNVTIAIIVVAAAGLLTHGIAAPISDGRVVYSNNTTTPQSRPYTVTTNSFGTNANPATTAGQSWFVVRACPTRNELIAAYAAGTTLYVTRWDGAAWQPAFNVSGPTVTGRWFDVAYETSSGDAIVVYSNNSTTNELAYRTWNGTSWSAATTRASNRTAQIVNWVKLAPHPTTDAVSLAFSDTAQDLSALIWDGAAWGNEPGAAHETVLSRSATSGDYDTFDLAYESSGELLLVWGSENGTYNDARYVRFTTAWSAISEVANLGVIPAHVSLAADPGTDNVLLAFSRDAGSTRLYGSYWNGASWSAPTRLDNVAGAQPPVGSAVNRRPFSTAWLTSGATRAGMVPYSTSAVATTMNFFYYDVATSTWNYASWTPGGTAIADEQWLRAVRDPGGSDTAMVTFSDANSDLWAKRVVFTAPNTFTWTNADGGAALSTALSSITTQNFCFDYDRLPRVTMLGDGANPADSALCPGAAARAVDSFTLQTNRDTDTVTGCTVALAPGTWGGVSRVEITDDAETTIYGWAAPTADSVAITFTTNIAVTTTATPYHIRIQPDDALSMPAIPGGTYAVTATVSSLTCTNPVSGTDAASATATIDNQSPADATWGANSAGNASVTLNWTNPATDFSQVVILRSTSSGSTDRPVEGTAYTAPGTIGTSAIVYVGSLQTFTDTTVANDTTYYYAIFARDTCGNYAAGATSGPLTPEAPDPRVRVLAGAATVDSCSQITVSAPFSKDTPVSNSTTTFERATSIGGPWTAICSAVAGASPRTCVSSGLTSNTTYYYQVTFTDSDGVDGQNPQIVGPYTTKLSCGADPTTVGTVQAQVNSCNQITAIAPFTGDDNANGDVAVEYNTTNTWPGTIACAQVAGSSPRDCVVTGLLASTNYYVRVTYTDADGVTGTNPQVAGPVTTTACAADTVPPMILFLAPSRDAMLNGTDRLKVQIWDTDGVPAGNVQFAIDAGAFSVTGIAANTNYSCGTGCTVYEFDLATGSLTNGPHSLSIRATDAAGNIGRDAVPFFVNNGPTAKGGGILLRRTQSSQFCNDCHALSTHSAQTNSTTYGNWAIDCMTCHTPHGTPNVELVRPAINTPRNGRQAVDFRVTDRTGASNPQWSFLGDKSGVGGAPFTDGICETCHTKTDNYRNDASGNHSHYASERCTGCHRHSTGFFAAESTGGYTCADCHGAIWRGMTGITAKTSKHSIGSVVGTNDAYIDNATSFTAPLRTSTTAAERLCLSCHQDHVHNPVAGTTHDYNVHQDASTNATRAVTRGGGGVIASGTPANTDFDNAATNGGMCISCHRNVLDTGGIALDKAGFNASAHNYTSKTVGASTYSYTYLMHGTNGTFNRNCTKCHSDASESAPGVTSLPFGAVHYSDNPDLLAGTRNPNGAPASFVCYNCHGNGTTGTDRSGKIIATQMAKTRNHPSNADNAHDGTAEYLDASFGNALGGPARHSNCMDCHDSHKAKPGVHTPQTNLAGPSLEGAWGAQLSTNPTFWAAPTSTNFTKKIIVAGTDAEATLCFKCHSSYYGTLPTTPSGTFTETDQAREFNPNNSGTAAPTRGGFHPVLASAGNNLGATSNIITPWTRTSLMTCSDCHASDITTDPAGPHGSAAGFLLKGPNTTWNNTIATASTGMPNGTFCINCHNQNFANSRFPDHTTRNDHYVACWNCHAAIPHGTSQPGLLVSGGTYGNKTTDVAPWNQAASATGSDLWIISYPTNNTTNWSENNCGCGGTGH